jgi:tetratricopeptide (TPR) repeat protein
MRRFVLPVLLVSVVALVSCAEKTQKIPGAPGGKDMPTAKQQAEGKLPGDETIKNPEVAYNMALEFAGQANMEAAHHYIILAMKLRADSKYTYTQGLFFLSESKFQDAIANFQLALQQGPGTVDNRVAVLNASGVCYKELGQDEEALKNFREVVNTPGLFSRYESYYNMGVIYMRQKKNLDAESVFMKVVEENPGYYRAYNKLGLLDAAKDDWKGALANYKRAVELMAADYTASQADGSEIYCNYGEALFHEKLYPQSRNALLQVLRIAPESAYGQRAKELLTQLGGT